MDLKLHDVPTKYHHILNELWSCNSDMDVAIYLYQCHPQKRKIAESLIELIKLEIIDSNFESLSKKYIPEDFNDKLMDIIKNGPSS